MNTTHTHQGLLDEIRYAQRLCQRTARLYRHIQAAGVFGSVMGGSAVVADATGAMPAYIVMAGALVFAAFGAMMLAMRPGEKAAANELEVKKYGELLVAGRSMDVDELTKALDRARTTDTPEVECLRAVAWNDLAEEIGAADRIQLKPVQRLIRAIA